MNDSPDDARADEAYRNHLAQSWWPQPPTQPVDPRPPMQPQEPLPGRQDAPPSVWHSIGVGALGLVAGLFAAFLLQDVLGIVFVLNEGSLPLGVAAAVASLMPILAITGVVVALLIDKRARARRQGSGAPDKR